MKDITHIEENVSKKAGPKRGVFLAVSLVALAAGVVLSYQGYLVLNGNSSAFMISADSETETTPPVPPQPLPSATPVTPAKLTDTSGSTTIKSGWSIVDIGSDVDLSFLSEKKVALYSFNDPLYPLNQWVVYPFASSSNTPIAPRAPLGYYLYNPGESFSLDLVSVPVTDHEEIFARGWHLLRWSNSDADKNELMKSVYIEYANGTKLSLDQAASAEIHSASSKIYVKQCEEAGNCDTETKGLSDTNSANKIDKISKDDFFWIYLRRTRVRAVDISISAIN